MIKVLIIETDMGKSIQLSNVINSIHGVQVISIINNTTGIYNKIKYLKPNIVVLNLEMKNIKIVSLLKRLMLDKEIENNVHILTYTENFKEVSESTKLKIIKKNFENIQICGEAFIEISRIIKEISNKELTNKIFDQLFELGFTVTKKGTKLLEECIKISIEKEIENLKVLYEEIAKRKQIKIYTIKSDIQVSINSMWNSADKENVRKILRLGEYENPTVKSIVSMVKYYIERNA